MSEKRRFAIMSCLLLLSIMLLWYANHLTQMS